jgi:hypothetical protein
MTPYASLIYELGVFGGPITEKLFGNFKLTVDEMFDLKIINPATMRPVFGLQSMAPDNERFPSTFAGENGSTLYGGNIIMKSSDNNRFFLHLSSQGKLTQMCFVKDRIVGKWESTHVMPDDVGGCYLKKATEGKNSVFMLVAL